VGSFLGKAQEMIRVKQKMIQALCAPDRAAGVADGVRWKVRDSGLCLCAYVGIPEGHALADIQPYGRLPLRVHGGLTFSERGGVDRRWEKGLWWYGWDYGHAGDFMPFPGLPGRGWSLREVEAEAKAAAREMARLMRLSEKAGVQAVLEGLGDAAG
jgi:hypothetical protein